MFGAPDDGEEVEEPPAAGERGQGGVARLVRLLRLLGLVTVGLGPDQRQHQPAHTPPVQHPHYLHSHYLSSLLSHGERENAVTGTFRARLMLIFTIYPTSSILLSACREQHEAVQCGGESRKAVDNVTRTRTRPLAADRN